MKTKTPPGKRGNRTPADFQGTVDALRQSEEKYRNILDNIEDGYYEADLAGNLTFFNDSLCRISGFSRQELTGLSPLNYTSEETSKELSEVYNKVYTTGQSVKGYVYPIDTPNGIKKFFETSVTLRKDDSGKPIGFMGIVRDITERKAVEEALRQSEEKYRTILESIEDGYYEIDLAGNVTFCNDSICRIWGYSKDELLGMNNRQYMDKETAAKLYAAHNQVYKTGQPGSQLDFEIIRKDGTTRIVQASFSLLKNKETQAIGFRGVIRDVTEHKRAEDALRQNEYFLRKSQEVAQLGSFDLNIKTSQWVSSPILDKIFGIGNGYSKNVQGWLDIIYPEDREEMHRYLLEHVVKEKNLFEKEYRIIRQSDTMIRWVYGLGELTFDEDGNTTSMIGTIQDITPKKKLEQERQDSIDSLRKSLGATIRAMSATVEARDPYTAGHQRRVADLARAIATEMKLSRDQIDGIRLAGMIHDLGKISVPSEILTKPTRLTKLELELIRTHSEAGYNILKDIEFPWPIARIVLEHHERIDGSGYPKGLKGEEILLESKIISIADVVEAISSNRPYRPAFGIEPALEEIAKNSGILYDAKASEACLKIFREKQYNMLEQKTGIEAMG